MLPRAFSDFMILEARFLGGERGPLFVVERRPGSVSANRGAALVVSPFAEEMNRSRRFITALGEHLAVSGVHTCVLDLYGTGDSAGEFSDASWSGWVEDVVTGIHALTREHDRPVWLIGVRTGALLALEAMRKEADAVAGLALIQPVTNGRRFMQQFLRMRIAANMQSGIRESTKDLMQKLDAGDCVEVAGYSLPGPLALPLAACRVEQDSPPSYPVLWYEIVQNAESMGGGRLQPPESWPSGIVESRLIAGEAFWQVEEPPAVPQPVIDAVVEDLSGHFE